MTALLSFCLFDLKLIGITCPALGVGREPSHTSRLHQVLITAVSPRVPHWLTDGETELVSDGVGAEAWGVVHPEWMGAVPTLRSRPRPEPQAAWEPAAAPSHLPAEKRWPEIAAPPKWAASFPFSGGALSVEVVVWFSDRLTISFGA